MKICFELQSKKISTNEMRNILMMIERPKSQLIIGVWQNIAQK